MKWDELQSKKCHVVLIDEFKVSWLATTHMQLNPRRRLAVEGEISGSTPNKLARGERWRADADKVWRV